MNDLTQTGFDYGVLPVDSADQLRTWKIEIAAFTDTVESSLVQIGLRFQKAQDELSRQGVKGEGFVAWIESETKYSCSSAYNLINVAEKFKDKPFPKFGKSVLYALAAPSTPETVIQQAIEKAESGEKVTVDWVKERKQIEAQLESERLRREAAERALHQSSVDSMAARQKINELSEQIDLLKNTETPEPEIKEVIKEVEKPVIPPEFSSLEEAIAAKQTEIHRLKAETANWEQKRDSLMAHNRTAYEALQHLKTEKEELELLLSQHKAAEREMIEHRRLTDSVVHFCANLVADLRCLEHAPNKDQYSRWLQAVSILKDSAAAIEIHLAELGQPQPLALEGELLEAA